MNDYSLLAQGALGFLLQWARGPKAIPNWSSYVVVALASVVLYWWMDPNSGVLLHSDWRQLVAKMAAFFLGARGAAGLAKDARLAPKSGTL